MRQKLGMIDIGGKQKTLRIAVAAASVKLGQEIIERIRNNDIPKGDVLETARIAAILAAKRTPQLLPLCHPIELENVAVEFSLKEDFVYIEVTAKATAKTGVEMEALCACSVAALTIYDMCKMFSKAIQISNIELLEKSGGKSGSYKKGVAL
ncbi:MAG: cyclic pyranopterin monophosphate synthase MoaC [Candidatus Omnitrophica bacterium]|nr:cyclic pyranopterin monophosphate synthase MoaC [Candidatus Omnitrophota bacterium]